MVSIRHPRPTASFISTLKVSDFVPFSNSVGALLIGLDKIEALEAYHKVKSIWLESNTIKKIENLDHMTGMRCL